MRQLWHRRWPGGVALLVLLPVAALADCGEPATPLTAVRGTDADPLPEGRRVTVEGTVTGSFPGREGLDGFYIESAATPRAGVFVYAPELTPDAAPKRSERWRLSARTGRYRGRIQLESVGTLIRCGSATLNPAPLPLPATAAELAAHSDRLVRLEGPLVVTDVWDLARYGSLGLATPQRRMHRANGTPGGEPAGVVLDDGSYRRGPEPVPHLDAAGTRRLGSRIESAVGVLTRAFGAWRLHPVRPVTFAEANPRRAAPRRPDGGLRAVNFNLRNYFLDRDGRGPDTQAGFERQRRRLAATLAALDADVLALHEIENRAAAVRDLLRLVNSGQGIASRYVAAAAAMDRRGVIRSALLYRPARLALAAVRLDTAAVHDRPPVIADFRGPDSSRLRVAAAHFKSRGGCPDAGDVDRGEGCWAQRRQRQAAALATALAAGAPVPTLLLGDLNAYPGERPLGPLRAAGFADLMARGVPADRRYTYVYRGAAGYLDHALGSAGLSDGVMEVAVWHANADEPPFLATRGAGIWRASDHDPVVVDLRWPAGTGR